MARRVKLASIQETSLSTIDAYLDGVMEMSTPDDHSQGDMSNETNVQHLLKLFGIKPSIPARLNELQFQLFTDFVFTWRFYLDGTFTWDSSSSSFSSLAIGLLRIAAWDLEVRDTDTEELPVTFSSLPQWKAPLDEIFWFHKYLIVCCNTDKVGSMIEKARHFVSQSTSHQGPVHGIAISIRNISLFEICNGNILRSSPIPLVTNTSALHCSPGFRILAYIFTSHRGEDFPANSKEQWASTLPAELFEMILTTFELQDLISMARASGVVEKWYYSSIPQMHGLIPQNFAFSIPCCVCYAWSHLECAGLSTSAPSGIEEFRCSDCQESTPCTSLERGGIHQFYRQKRKRQACSVVHRGKTVDFPLRVSKSSSRRPELGLIRSHGPPPPRQVDRSIFFSGVFSGLAYGFDQ
ncbi:unnamed protein product [Penicillium bialowiezense]